ncbi:MAG: hypothetical protein HYS12_14595 [Planctomycetes bacterium]|nr:hypothetical protein [Planctomycetota bacterium]
MAETLPAGTRRVPSSGSDLADVAVLDQVFADGGATLATPFLDGSVLQTLLNLQKQHEGGTNA